MILEPEFESLPVESMRELQGTRLRGLVAYLAERVPMYRERLAAAGVAAGDIRSIDDLARLPITRKGDLRDHYPFGLLAVPREQVMRVHASSGTTGKATVVAYTANDVALFARVCARSLAMAGAAPGMMLHNAYGYGLFTGGLGIHYGGERLGLSVVPVSGGMTERQMTLITDFRPDVITCTPSYALTLATEFARRGIAPGEISLRYAVLGAEPWTDGMRVQIDAALGVRSTNIYGLSEIIGPGVSCECVEARDGSHVMEDHFYPEILDPDTQAPVADGEEGVLVLTTLTKEALPLLRYWTGDITSLVRGSCACGRTLVRMRLVKGRTDDMLIIRGVNVYPSQVEAVLGRVPELSPHYCIVVTREETLHEIEVQAEVADSFFREVGRELLSDDVVEADLRLRELRQRVAGLLRDVIGVGMSVTLLAPGEAPRSEGGKLNRVVDRRAR
ncbi:MAG: phenylacetate--CoA ligase [Gemmatimonadaceae bacterium]|nr:phenylacetate--CoA ligase [Gemmatimonadaceae bacterium]